ncbi:MAG: transposase [Prevotella sp.]|nr:transposase [Prevotella sp.]MBR3080634.1 transposase [Prevotella sp.]
MSIIRREKSRIGVYHVLAQGAGNHELFHDDEDYQVFVEYLGRLMKEAWAEDEEPDRPYFHTYAYCLTPKQFRLIVKEEKYQVSAIMQSISQLYSRYYSGKYNSYGPLYRRRYYSEPINDEERMEVVMRYVHQEPQRLGIIKEPQITQIARKEMSILEPQRLGVIEEPQITQIAQKDDLDEWEWSSWHEYVGLGSDLPIVCEKPDACKDLTEEQWRELLGRPLPEGTKCLEPKEYRAPKPTETQVLSMVRLMTTATTWDEFKAIPKDEKLKTIKQLLQNGASIRQMEKLTGIGRGIIQNL